MTTLQSGTMTYDEVVQGRRSIRGFKPEPVPPALIREVLAGWRLRERQAA